MIRIIRIRAQQELKHALIISKQIDYLGKMPTVTPKPVRTSEKAKEMLRFDLDNAGEMAGTATQQVKTFAEAMAKRNPLGTIAGAVVVGVLIGLFARGRTA
jgi:bacterioferritin (cytochrome b1)